MVMLAGAAVQSKLHAKNAEWNCAKECAMGSLKGRKRRRHALLGLPPRGSSFTFPLCTQINNQNGVFLDDADQEDDANERDVCVRWKQ